MKPEQINSQTNCPTCNSKVSVSTEGDTHFYIPFQQTDYEKGYDIAEKIRLLHAELPDCKLKKYMDKWFTLKETETSPDIIANMEYDMKASGFEQRDIEINLNYWKTLYLIIKK